MVCGQSTVPSCQHLVATSTDVLYCWLTGWMPAIGVDDVKAVLRNKAITGNLESRCQSRLVMQTAISRTDNPSAPTLLESAWSSNLEGLWHGGDGEFPTGELSLSIASSMWVRIGIEHQLSSGSDGEALVSVAVGVRRA